MIAREFIFKVICTNQEQKGFKHRARRHAAFYDAFAQEVAIQVHPKFSVLKELLHPVGYLEVDPHR